jgi:hypothetical protein
VIYRLSKCSTTFEGDWIQSHSNQRKGIKEIKNGEKDIKRIWKRKEEINNKNNEHNFHGKP